MLGDVPDTNYVAFGHWSYLQKLFVPLQWYHFCFAYQKSIKRRIVIIDGQETTVDVVDPKMPDNLPKFETKMD